jgi:hypothetical protein
MTRISSISVKAGDAVAAGYRNPDFVDLAGRRASRSVRLFVAGAFPAGDVVLVAFLSVGPAEEMSYEEGFCLPGHS